MRNLEIKGKSQLLAFVECGKNFQDFADFILYVDGNAKNAAKLEEGINKNAIRYRFDYINSLYRSYGSGDRLKNVKDTVFLLIGGIGGLGIKSDEYYYKLLSKVNNKLASTNSCLLVVRGVNDDPSYYDGNDRFGLKNIVLLQDYTVVNTCGKKILVIGGGASKDKKWKSEAYGKNNTSCYWKDEAPKFDADALKEIAENGGIDIIATYTTLSFVGGTRPYRSKWEKGNSSTSKDIISANRVIEDISNELNDLGIQPQFWVSKVKGSNLVEKIGKTQFFMLGSRNFLNLTNPNEMKKGFGKKLDVSFSETIGRFRAQPLNNFGIHFGDAAVNQAVNQAQELINELNDDDPLDNNEEGAAGEAMFDDGGFMPAGVAADVAADVEAQIAEANENPF